MTQLHTTKNVIIEKASVDEEMVELIKLFNRLADVRTLYCCQGDEYTDGSLDNCYLVFDCGNTEILHRLAYTICRLQYGIIQIFWQSDAVYGRLMWSLNIRNIKNKQSIIAALKKWTNK